jgi:hypothetical protein
LLNLFARKIQHPAEKDGIALFLSSEVGAGKNITIEYLARMFGDEHVLKVDDMEDVAGQFNLQLSNKLITIIDEISDAEKYRHKFKSLITQITQNVRGKFINSFKIEDFNMLIMLSNDRFCIPLDNKDRRYYILDCSSKYIGDTVHFNDLVRCQTLKNLEIIFNYLAKKDLSKFEPRKFPKTRIWEELQDQTKEGVLKTFLKENFDGLRQVDGIDVDQRFIRGVDLHEDFVKFLDSTKSKFKISRPVFTTMLKSFKIESRQHRYRENGIWKNQNHYFIDFKDLELQLGKAKLDEEADETPTECAEDLDERSKEMDERAKDLMERSKALKEKLKEMSTEPPE